MGVSLSQARSAKRMLAEQLSSEQRVNGIGIVRSDADYALKVNLIEPLQGRQLPSEVKGVKVVSDVVGPAVPL